MQSKANKKKSGFMMQAMFVSYLAFWKQTWNK